MDHVELYTQLAHHHGRAAYLLAQLEIELRSIVDCHKQDPQRTAAHAPVEYRSWTIGRIALNESASHQRLSDTYTAWAAAAENGSQYPNLATLGSTAGDQQ